MTTALLRRGVVLHSTPILNMIGLSAKPSECHLPRSLWEMILRGMMLLSSLEGNTTIATSLEANATIATSPKANKKNANSTKFCTFLAGASRSETRAGSWRKTKLTRAQGYLAP